MSWVRRLLANFGHAPRVAKRPEPDLPLATVKLHRDAQAVLHDLRELKRFEIIVVRKR